jgi:hypothetical protein
LTEPPPPEAVQRGTVWFYPHKDGHTLTLIDNLNAVIADDPELLEGSGLTAPLTLDAVVNEQDAVWVIIHKLDPGQMERFRSH